MEHYDVIIIGTGAGGGTLAHKLAPSGKRILLLERGGYLPREPENWDSREIFRKERYLDDELWYDKDGNAVQAPPAVLRRAATPSSTGRSCSGCASATSTRSQHYGGVSPAWPISYADLEPYYAEAEKLYLVHGQAGEDPTEPRRSGPFPYPAVSHEPRIQQLADDFERTGHHPFHLPVGIDLDESDPEAGRCVRCDRFDGFPCLTDGKADAHVRCVRPALDARQRQADHARQGGAPRDRPERPLGHPRPRQPPRHARDLQRRHRGRLVRGDELGGAAAEVRQRPASARAGELLRRGRAVTTWRTSTRA